MKHILEREQLFMLNCLLQIREIKNPPQQQRVLIKLMYIQVIKKYTISKRLIIVLVIPAGRIYFIGATASNKLSVVIVGITIIIKESVFFTPPSPTASPTEQPTINSMTQIIP